MELNYFNSLYSPDYKEMTMKEPYHGLLNDLGFAQFNISLIDSKGTQHDNITALIDTGANLTSVTHELHDKLKGEFIKYVPLGVLGNKEEIRGQLYGNTRFLFKDENRRLEYVPNYIHHKGVDIILGTVFLQAYCHFIYNVYERKFSFLIK